MSMFPQSPSKIRESIIDLLRCGLVPMVRSSPGLGKSNIAAQIAKDSKLIMIDIRLSQTVPEDMMGLPVRGDDGKAHFMTFDMFPTKGTPIPKGYNGWLIFCDEFNSASKSVEAAAYKLILDRMVGMEELHDNAFVMAAGNLETDRAIVRPLSSASKSRLVHLFLEPSVDDFMDYAISQDFDSRVLAYLQYQSNKLHQFNPDSDDHTYPCPRTWEFTSKYLSGKPNDEINLAVVAGIIGDGTAVEFHQFISEFDKLPNYFDILRSPETTHVPSEPSTRYALVMTLIDRFKSIGKLSDYEEDDAMERTITYMKRLSPEFQIIYFNRIIKIRPEIRRKPVFANNINHLTQYIKDSSDDVAA